MRAHHRLVLAASLASSTFTSAQAFAQTASCPTPTIQMCRDPQYLATDCGQAERKSDTGTCAQLLRAAYQTAVQGSDVQVKEVMPPDRPGNTVPAASKTYGFTNHLVQNLTGQFMGDAQRSQLMSASGGAIGLITDGVTRLGLQSLQSRRDAWNANGNAVGSCTEYVHELYNGYTAFRDAADSALLSEDVVFDRMYDPASGIANRTLYSKSGLSTLPPVVFPSNGVVGHITVGGKPRDIIDPRSPKNGFFKAYKSLAQGSFFGTETAIRGKLQAGQSHHVIDWNWHNQMRTALAAYDPETLKYFDDMQQEFLTTVAERDKVLALIAQYGTTMTTTDACNGDPSCVPTVRDLQAELTSLESMLWDTLNKADTAGCLDPTQPTKCDWSFNQVRNQVDAFYAKQMEAAYQQCIAYTGGNFIATSGIRNATRYNAPKNDYTTTAEDVPNYYPVLDTYVASAFPPDSKGNPSTTGERNDQGTLGSGDIKVDWAYDAKWRLDRPTNAKACDSTLDVEGAFSAVGHAYGTDVSIIDAKAKVNTQKGSAKAAVKLIVLDETVWNRWDNPYTTELSTGLVQDMKSGANKSFSTTVYPFGIPVTLSAGVGMSVGLKFNMKASAGIGCDTSPANVTLASVNGSLTPWAQADAFASAAVGIEGFEAGLKCDLVLVHGEMPISANASLTYSSSKTTTASLSFTGQQTFRMLDGSIKAFVDAPVDFLDSEWTLFSWKGPSINQQLFAFQKDGIPLDLLP